MEKAKILLVDDHQIVLDGISSILSERADWEIIGHANNGKDALQFIKIAQPDLVMMDIDMPIMNGIVAAKESKKTFPDVKIIILSLHSEKSIIQNLIQYGVDGYVLKNSNKQEVLSAVDQVLNGNKYFSADVTMSLSGLSPSHNKNQLQHQNESHLLSQLTEREVEILKRVAEGLSNKEIAAELFISHRTVDTHRQNIMKKLNVNKVVGLIKFAIKNGLVE